MREADSLKSRSGSGAALRSFSMIVPLVAITRDQGCWLAGKRPPDGKQGVSVP